MRSGRGRLTDRADDEVLFIEDLAKVLRSSRRTIYRALRARTFPIPPLPSIDKRKRWSRAVVEKWLADNGAGSRATRGR